MSQIIANPYIKSKKLDVYSHINELGLKTGSDYHGEYISRPLYTMQHGVVGHERIYTKHSIEGQGKYPKHTNYDKWYKELDRDYSPALYTPINHLCDENSPRDKLIIVGGLADGIAVHMATKLPVMALKGEGEASKLVNDIREVLNSFDIEIICALDHDRAGILAAADSGVDFTYPSQYEWKSDWNDVYIEHGLESVAKSVAVTIPALTNHYEILKTVTNETGRSYRQLTDVAFEGYEFPTSLTNRTGLLNHFSKLTDEKQVFLAAKQLLWDLRTDLTVKYSSSKEFIEFLVSRYNPRINRQNRDELIVCADRIRASVDAIAEGSIRVDYKTVKRHNNFNRFKSSEEAAPHVMEMNGVTFVQAGHGDGKTSKIAKPYLKAAVKNGRRSGSIAHLRSLVADLKSKFGGEHYQDAASQFADVTRYTGIDSDEWASIGGVNMISICVPSLTNGLKSYFTHCDTLVIDEVSQVVRFLTSDLCNVETLLAFTEIVKNTKNIVCLDADLDTLTVEFFEKVRADEKFNIVRVPNQKTDMVLDWHTGGDGNQYIESTCALAIDALKDGHKIALATDTKMTSKAVETIIAESCPDARIMLVNRDTSSNPEQLDFLANATEMSYQYDVIIYSPTIRSGVSIENPEYTRVFGIFGGKTITSSEAIQMLRRCRSAREFVVGVSSSVYSTAISHKELLEAGEEANRIASAAFKAELDTNALYDELCARVSELDSFNKLNFSGIMLRQLKMYGFKVNLNDLDEQEQDENDEESLSMFDEICKAINSEEKSKIINAKRITQLEAESFKKRDNLSEEERHQLIAYQIRDLFDCEEISEKHLSLYKQGARTKAYRLFWAMKGDPEEEKHADSIMRRRYWGLQGKYIKQLANMLGFDSVDDMTGIEAGQMEACADYIWDNRRILHFLRLVPSKYISRPKFDYKGRVVKYTPVEKPSNNLSLVKAFCKSTGLLFGSKTVNEPIAETRERLGESATKKDRAKLTNLVAKDDFYLILKAARKIGFQLAA